MAMAFLVRVSDAALEGIRVERGNKEVDKLMQEQVNTIYENDENEEVNGRSGVCVHYEALLPLLVRRDDASEEEEEEEEEEGIDGKKKKKKKKRGTRESLQSFIQRHGGMELIIPDTKPPKQKRDEKLQERIERLRREQEEEEYAQMTRGLQSLTRDARGGGGGGGGGGATPTSFQQLGLVLHLFLLSSSLLGMGGFVGYKLSSSVVGACIGALVGFVVAMTAEVALVAMGERKREMMTTSTKKTRAPVTIDLTSAATSTAMSSEPKKEK